VTQKVVSRQSLVVSQESDLVARFCARLEKLLSSSLATGDWRLATTLAVALSGGADSLALTLLAQQWAQAHNIHLVALTVDHRLREDSTEEAAKVAQVMRSHGITHRILTPAHRPAGNNRMQAARQWRYDALADYCLAHGIQYCLLGHHRDDQLETAAMAHLRGTNQLDLSRTPSDGEAGMRSLRTYRGVDFLRPLLAHSKADLCAFLEARGEEWIEDPTNADARYARTRVRQLLSSDDDFKRTIEQLLTRGHIRREANEALLAEAMPNCIARTRDMTTLMLAPWRALDVELRSLMLANLIREVGGKPHRPRRAETLRLAEALLNEPRGKRTLGHCLIVWNNGEATLRREARVQKITPPPST
jgi:tRNA(Ile)-lysidine synthase